jgi:branched-chain amino acid transport system permease protein
VVGWGGKKLVDWVFHLPLDLEPWTIYGILLIVLMYTMPMGIAGGLALLWRRIRGS